MPERDEWHQKVSGIIKAELKRRNMTYKQLVDRLVELGVHESERNIANKLSRGGFTAVFFVQCLVAMGVSTVRLDD
ncbi:hypothetical protein DRB17_18590 [Ferruginivarius sediminum]|uniref:DUF6471 domain-containing protein n=2 Tax=Ferruginivarius sediminum TaxID=2661937 RepID=A0A369T7P4_9PROT|nr:hypothetical protein DRB17_18590 [Ferruginivarius sediminum]